MTIVIVAENPIVEFEVTTPPDVEGELFCAFAINFVIPKNSIATVKLEDTTPPDVEGEAVCVCVCVCVCMYVCECVHVYMHVCM
jgi:hypothetical protein